MIIDGVRKLASIRTISAINDIENADMIKVAIIDGWKVVVKANKFNVGMSVFILKSILSFRQTILVLLFLQQKGLRKVKMVLNVFVCGL